jgi:hypothetical protein
MRAETGPMKFGDDWTGIFIRGDNAAGFAIALDAVLNGLTDPFAGAVLMGLRSTLRNADERTTHLSDTQVMKPFSDAAQASDARLTDLESGKATGSATDSSLSPAARDAMKKKLVRPVTPQADAMKTSRNTRTRRRHGRVERSYARWEACDRSIGTGYRVHPPEGFRLVTRTCGSWSAILEQRGRQVDRGGDVDARTPP